MAQQLPGSEIVVKVDTEEWSSFPIRILKQIGTLLGQNKAQA